MHGIDVEAIFEEEEESVNEVPVGSEFFISGGGHGPKELSIVVRVDVDEMGVKPGKLSDDRSRRCCGDCFSLSVLDGFILVPLLPPPPPPPPPPPRCLA